MKIIGTGIDIIETARVQQSVERFGDRFLRRCFSDQEIAYCQQMKLPALHLAARFAAKEAISKAFGTGIGRELGWRDMEILRRQNGAPYVLLHDQGINLAARLGVNEVLVSLSHTKDYSAAQAIAVGD